MRKTNNDRTGSKAFRLGAVGVFITLLLALAGMGVAQSGGDGGSEGQIVICHFPPGNPGNAHTITISPNAWPAHEAHGDIMGPCEDENGEPRKITICHFPPGNPENAHQINISINAWPAHRDNHGDVMGPCPTAGDGDDGGDGNVTEPEGEACPGPGHLHAHTMGDAIHLEWEAVVNATGYNVYRAEGDGEFVVIATTDNATLMYTDEDVTPQVTYRYRVTALLGDDETMACETAEVTAIPVFGTLVAGGAAMVLGLASYVALRRRR